MISKNNSFQENRAMQQHQQRQNVRAAMAPYRKPFRNQAQAQSQSQGHKQAQGQSHKQMMYASCQMPSDPLYIDFNNPPPVQIAQTVQSGPGTGHGPRNGQTDGGKKKQMKGKQQKGSKHHQQQQQQQQNQRMQFPLQMHACPGIDNNWQPQQYHGSNVNCFIGPQRNGFNRVQMGGGPTIRGGNGVGAGIRHMMCPMGPRPIAPGAMGPRCCPGPVGGGPMSPYRPMPFQPPMPPMRCPMPPCPLPCGPHFMRYNGRAGPNHPPIPVPLMGPHMMGPRIPIRPMICDPGLFKMNRMNVNLNAGKIKKPNPNLVKHAVKGKSTIKTLKNLVNQYPINKPWVDNELRGIHDKKLDIENRLKGKKDDELFAQFKLTRDKFVSMYESAREAYLKKEAATVMAKDAKDKNSNSNKNAAAKVGFTKDATIPKQIQTELNINVEQPPILNEAKDINIILNNNNNNSNNNKNSSSSQETKQERG